MIVNRTSVSVIASRGVVRVRASAAGTDVVGTHVAVCHTGRRVVGMYASRLRYAAIVCTPVTVIAIERARAHARSVGALIGYRACISVIAGASIIGMSTNALGANIVSTGVTVVCA
jgi:hypothetical protein